jgi:TP901 family phage tail tape measure protein
MLGIGGAALAGFAIAVNSAADFESQLSGIKAVSQGTEEQMEAVREKALQLGADTKFSAGEAALAIEELSRKGIPLEGILGGAADAVVNLSAATGTELVTSATIASNAMNVFGIAAEDLDKVTNQIAGFDVVGSSVEDFGMALTQSAAVADLVGVSFEDLTTTIAAMSKAGINSSDAGTSIKTFLNNLQPTTEKQIALARELGIVTEDGTNNFYDQNGQLKSMQEVAGVLNGAMAGLTDQQKQLALETLFGSDAIRAAAVISEQGAEGFGTLSAQIAEVDAGEQAAIRMDNLSGSIEQLKGSIETYLIGAGSPFLDSIRSIVDMITQLVNWFGSLPAPVQKLIGQFVLFGGLLFGVAGAGLLVTGTFIKFASNLATLGKAISGVSSVFKIFNLTLLANPIVLIVVALIALGVALVIAYKKSEKFRKFVDKLWATIKDVWTKIVDFFKKLPEFFSNIWKQVTDAFDAAADAVVDAFNGVIQWFQDLPGVVADALGSFASTVGDAFMGAVDAATDFAKELPGVVAGALEDALKAAIDFLTKLPERFAYFLGLVIGTWIKFHLELVQLVFKIGSEVVKTVIDFLTQLPGIVLGFLTTVKDLFFAALTDIYEDNVRFWTDVVQFIIAKLGEFIAWLPGFLVGVFNQFVSWGQQLIGWAVSTFINFVQSVVNQIMTLPGKVFSFLTQIITGLPGFATQMFNGAVNIGKQMWNGLTSGIGDLVGLVRTMVTNAINGVGNLAQTAYNKMRDVGSSMWNGFKSGLGISSPSFIEVAAFQMNENVSKAIDTLGAQVRDIQSLGRTMPGVSETPALGVSTATTAVLGVTPASATAPQPQAVGLTVQGPLLHVDNINGTEQEVLDLSRKLADLTYKQLEAQGNRAARVNGAMSANG